VFWEGKKNEHHMFECREQKGKSWTLIMLEAPCAIIMWHLHPNNDELHRIFLLGLCQTMVA